MLPTHLSHKVSALRVSCAGLAIASLTGATLATTTASAAPLGPMTPITSVAASPISAGAEGPVVLDPHGDHEPSGTEIRNVDGTNVVFSYSNVTPEFSGWDPARREPTRRYISLDKTWKFRYDSENVGKTQAWFAPGLDESDWDGIKVPSAWDLKDNDGWAGYDGANFGKGGSLKDGYAWYRTTVDVPASWRGMYPRLAFLGAFYSADIWVNGTWVGKHEGGHTSFAIPLSTVLKPGAEASIAIRVFRRATYTKYDGTGQGVVDDYALPSGRVDWWPYAGLTRSVWLEAVPPVTIAKALLDTPGGTALDARVVIENHTSKAYRGQVLINPGAASLGKPTLVDVSVPAGGVSVPKATIPIPSAPRWSPSSPRMLKATATLVGGTSPDTLSSTYGARTVDVAGEQIVINGKPVFLKGVNWHEETDKSGRSMSRQEYDVELSRLKDLGVNLLRNAVYSRHPYSYDWTDRNGVMVLDEWDTMWVTTGQQAIQLKYGLSKMMAAQTAWNNHNHPSIIMWGLQNESTADTTTYRDWLADMKSAVSDVDLADRPVTWATYTSNDKAFDLADVVGFNEYFGYFYGKNEDLGPALDATHKANPGKPIVITENGSWAWPLGNRGKPTDVGTEDWQAAGMESHWAQSRARPFVAGYMFWVYKDYKQRANYNMSLNGMSGMGLTAWDGKYNRLVYESFKRAR